MVHYWWVLVHSGLHGAFIGGFWFTLAQALIQLELVPQLLSLFDNSSGNISPKKHLQASRRTREEFVKPW
jgi:hypothetical protein